jgi:Fe-S-cluster containining protein
MTWYKKGLSFQCTGCGRCCTGSPGAVWVSEEEVQTIADSLGISAEEFCKKYTRMLGDRRALIEKKPKNGDYDCIFLQGKQCQIYSVRPKQCQTFPWWKENLASKKDWEDLAKECEGVNYPGAKLFSFEEIKEQLESP